VISFADLLRAQLVARETELSGPDRLELWLELRQALSTGDTVFGTTIPPEQLATVKSELLPELDARVETLGSSRAPLREDAAALLWPVRTREAEARLAKRVAALAHVNCWFEFSQVATHELDLLLAVGFAPGTDKLLAVAQSGLYLFDGRTRALVSHDGSDHALPDYPDWVEGRGPLASYRVPLMGIDGGVPLPRRSPDGWSLGVLFTEAGAVVWLSPRYDSAERPGSGSRRLARTFPELRAAGFSDTGRTLVLAEPHALHLFTRPVVPR
jgi:hypothetical protein